MFARAKDWLLCAVLFVLPLSTRFIYQAGELNGQFWEYGTLSLYGVELLTWLAVLVHFIYFFRTGFPIDTSGRKKRLVIAVVIIFFAVVAVIRSPLFEVTQQFFNRLMVAGILAIILVTRQHIERYWWVLWAGGVGQAALGIWQFLTQQVVANKWLGMAAQTAATAGSGVVDIGVERWLRAYGTFGGPNPLGSYLAIIAIVGCLLYLRQTGWTKWLALVGQGVVVSGLMASFSRGAWLAALVGFVVLLIAHQKQLKKVAPMVGMMLVVALVWLGSYHNLVVARVQATEKLETRSIGERREQYAQTWEILKHNAVFGTGPGMYTYILVRDFGVTRYQPIHNSFVLAVAELGILAGMLLLMAVYRWIFWIWTNNLALLPLVATFIIAACFEHFFWSLAPGLLISGIVVGLSLKRL